MFDTYLTERTTEYVTKNVNIREHKAPTDESVKLLNEMQDKALQNVIKKFSTSNNTFQATVAVFDSPIHHDREFLCKFTLNGKDHSLRVPINLWDCQDEYGMVEKLYKEICNKLAEDIMFPFLDELNKRYRY